MIIRVDQLTRQLASLGVVRGDWLMLHVSLRALGPTQHRAAGLLTALKQAVGPDGLLMMVLGAKDDWAWVNERPEHEREALLADATPFDALTTPAQPDVGLLAELFRQDPQTIVSDHPEGRFAAWGTQASALMAHQPWHDYYGPGSPLARFVEQGGKVLRIAADWNTVTALHYAEYLAEVPNKRRVRRYRRLATPSGPVIRTVDCLDDEYGIVDYPGEDYFADILRAYVGTGKARCGLVGPAPSELLDAADLVDFGVGWMAERLG